jgi:hypothetical protein
MSEGAPIAGRTGGRGRTRNRWRGAQSSATPTNSDKPGATTTFTGDTVEMNNHVFECCNEQNDKRQYAKTLEALEAYVKKNISRPEDLAPLFADPMASPCVKKPTKPEKDSDEVDLLIYQEEIKAHVKHKFLLTGNVAAVHAVIWGQCSEPMKSKVKSANDFKTKSEQNTVYGY